MNNVISQLIFHDLFLQDGSPMQIAPGSPREARSTFSGVSHQAYGWDQETRTKDPIKLSYSGHKYAGTAPSVTMLRIGHKIHETHEGTELPYKHEPEKRMALLRYVAGMIVDRAQGYHLDPSDSQFLDRTRTALYDKLERTKAKRQR